jgi:hypothetical protein
MRIPPQDLVRGEVEQVVQVWSVGWFGHRFWGRNQRNRREFSSVLYVAGTVLGRPGWRPARRGPVSTWSRPNARWFATSGILNQAEILFTFLERPRGNGGNIGKSPVFQASIPPGEGSRKPGSGSAAPLAGPNVSGVFGYSRPTSAGGPPAEENRLLSNVFR